MGTIIKNGIVYSSGNTDVSERMEVLEQRIEALENSSGGTSANVAMSFDTATGVLTVNEV